jgi:cell division protein ZapA (FtsZ GTPase activity inhibitor)
VTDEKVIWFREGSKVLLQPIKVKILGHEYLVKSEEEEEHVQRIAAYVNQKLEEISGNKEGLSEKSRAILAALNIAGEYFQALKERDELLANQRKRTSEMIYQIDSVIG